MAKKIYDIKPPKAVGSLATVKKPRMSTKPKKEKLVETEAVLTPVFPQEKKEVKSKKSAAQARKFPTRELTIGGLVIVILLGIFVLSKLPKATVQVSPNITLLEFADKITLSTDAKVVDFENKLIPARLVEVIKDGSGKFMATGLATNDGKAQGTITVYNKAASPLSLVKGTHFLSDSGKYFVTLARITIPGGSKSKPGSTAVQVEAKEVGESYNIGPSKFSVPKLSGNSYYFTTHGESNEDMAGGHTGNVKKVIADDIVFAKNELSKKLFKEANKDLEDTITSEEVMLDGAFVSVVNEYSTSAKANAIMEEFDATAQVKVVAIVFKKEDMDTYVKNGMVGIMPEDDTLIDESLAIEYITGAVDSKEEKLVVDVAGSGKTHADINTTALTEMFPRKSADQIKQTVDQIYGDKIAELKIDFWPFWVKKAPKSEERIKVELNLE